MTRVGIPAGAGVPQISRIDRPAWIMEVGHAEQSPRAHAAQRLQERRQVAATRPADIESGDLRAELLHDAGRFVTADRGTRVGELVQ